MDRRKINPTFDVTINRTGLNTKTGPRFDLTVWRHGQGWTTGDLSPGQLRQVRNAINRHLDALAAEAERREAVDHE